MNYHGLEPFELQPYVVIDALTYVPSTSVVCVIKCTAVSSTAEYMSFPSPSKLST